jgi:anti-sigma B factor antagonist
MKIERSLVAGNVPVLRLSGELDLNSVPDVRRSIRGLIDEGLVNFIINLTDLDFIDSSGLGVLVGGLARVREKQGEIKITCASKRIIRIFEMTRLTQLFELYPTEEEAARSFRISAQPQQPPSEDAA